MTRCGLTIFVAAFCAFNLAPSAAYAGAEGSLLIWGNATNISGDSDVSTNGSLVAAFNMFGPDVTVNGVTFSQFNVTGGTTSATNGNFTFTETPGVLVPANNFGSASAPFSNLSANYRTLLSSAISTSDNNTLTLAIHNLTVGQIYQFQFWTNASNFNPNFGFDTVATSPLPVTVDANTTNANGGVGQWVIGTFTCGDPNQFITFNGTNSSQAPTVNAFQLRNVSVVPEPSSLSLLAIGAAFGYVKLQRRKKP